MTVSIKTHAIGQTRISSYWHRRACSDLVPCVFLIFFGSIETASITTKPNKQQSNQIKSINPKSRNRREGEQALMMVRIFWRWVTCKWTNILQDTVHPDPGCSFAPGRANTFSTASAAVQWFIMTTLPDMPPSPTQNETQGTNTEATPRNTQQ